MKEEFRTVKASIEDVEQAAPLFDRYRQFYRQPADLETARKFLSERLERNESVVFLAVDGGSGQAAGFMQLYPVFSSISAKSAWILNDLFVHPDFRGRGIGRMLLEAAKRHAVETGAKGLSLSTAIDNFVAQKLYETFGFERDEFYYHYELEI